MGQAGVAFSKLQILSAAEAVLREWAEERSRVFESGPDVWERKILCGRIIDRLVEKYHHPREVARRAA
jgi:hypothetical protein